MHEILRHLSGEARILDLGSLTGSFRAECCPSAVIVRLDLEAPPPGACEGFVQADAARLPFPDQCFDSVIANHSLEHVAQLEQVLSEIARVVRVEGSLYVAVPDASTFSDRLFRWTYGDGRHGHVNPFCSADELAARITQVTGLKLSGSRALYSSFEYLNRYYFPTPTPWSLRLVGNGNRRCIVLLSYATRLFDRIFGTRTSAYGWAFYFGSVGEKIQADPWSNVCVGCGSGFSSNWLTGANRQRLHFRLFRSYRCPVCDSFNMFTADLRYPKARNRYQEAGASDVA
jgi:hypothetical protein